MLKLTKKGNKYWLFEDSEIGLFSPSKFTINLELNEIVIVYENGLKSKRYNVIDCEIYNLGELTPFTTSSGDLFMQKLEELNCPCFQKNENIYNIYGGGAWGDITGTLSDQTDLQTALDLKLDKVTTSGVERAYIINADGSQGTKATSEFGGGVLACQRFQGAGINPADNTYYNIGGSNNTTPVSVPMGNYAVSRIIKALATGNITKVLVSFTGGSGTGEASTIKIKNVTQTTEVTISTTITTNLAVNAQAVNVSLAVTQGDELVLEWLTPTYATNPTGVISYCEFTIE